MNDIFAVRFENASNYLKTEPFLKAGKADVCENIWVAIAGKNKIWYNKQNKTYNNGRFKSIS
jgi:hypothetical protein